MFNHQFCHKLGVELALYTNINVAAYNVCSSDSVLKTKVCQMITVS